MSSQSHLMSFPICQLNNRQYLALPRLALAISGLTNHVYQISFPHSKFFIENQLNKIESIFYFDSFKPHKSQLGLGSNNTPCFIFSTAEYCKNIAWCTKYAFSFLVALFMKLAGELMPLKPNSLKHALACAVVIKLQVLVLSRKHVVCQLRRPR